VLLIVFATTWGSLLLVDVSICLALTFGPVLLALSVMAQFRQLLGKWLGFVGGSILLKPILAVLIAISMLVLQQINTIASQSPTAETPQALIIGFTLMFLVVIWLIMQKATSIASSLFGGLSSGFGDAAGAITGGAGKAFDAVKPGKPNNPPPPPPPPPPPGK
jgi:hypothetical protein